MSKPYIKKEGKFMVAATYPLHYAGYSKPISKSLESLEEFEKKTYAILTKGHADKNGNFNNMGQLKKLSLEKKQLDGKEEAELYSEEILLNKKDVLSLKPGVYGLSPDFLYGGANLSDNEDGSAYVLGADNTEFTTVALVESPRHQVKDIDLSNLNREIVRNMYDSSGVDFDRVEDLPVLIVGNSSISLQDSASCDIIDISGDKTPKEEAEKSLIDSIATRVMALIGSKTAQTGNSGNTKEIDMNKEELEKILDERLSKIFEDKVGVALKDSAESLASEVSNLYTKLEGHISSILAPQPKEEVKEEAEKSPEEMLQALKEENTKLKSEVAEQAYLMQTMQKTSPSEESKVEEKMVSGSDEADKGSDDMSFLRNLLQK